MSSEVVTAVIAGLVSVVTAGCAFVASQRSQSRNLAAAEARHALAIEAEVTRQAAQIAADADRQKESLEENFRLQTARLRTELQTEFMAEAAIRQLLLEAQPMRSFASIKNRIGGFTDDGLRQLLVRSGAVRFWNHKETPKKELWGLRERNGSEAARDDETTN